MWPSILVDERADGVHLSYDSTASFLASYGNDYEVVAPVNTVFRWSAVFTCLVRFLTGRPNRLCAVNAA